MEKLPLRTRAYRFFITFPDRCYPFAAEIEGKRVRGIRSYERALENAFAHYGTDYLGYKLMAYRQVFHITGAILFILAAAFVSQHFFGTDIALYVLLGAAIFAITVQEFYLHPRAYHQHLPKGVIDWLAWVVPISAFLFMHLS